MIKTLLDPIFKNNPIALQILGICSALAVTTKLETAFAMGASVTLVLIFSSLFISLLRKLIPQAVRIIIQMVVISSFVIVADLFMQAYFFDLSKSLSVYVSLIITNCILLGRAEGFAMSHPPFLSAVDALGNGIGYSLILIIVAAIRELLSCGELLGVNLLGEHYVGNGLMYLAPSAFFIIATLIWIIRSIDKSQIEEDE